MSDDEKPKKLTLNWQKGKVDLTQIKHGYVHSTTGTVAVEIKKSNSPIPSIPKNITGDLTNSEIAHRLNVLKHAADSHQLAEQETKNKENLYQSASKDTEQVHDVIKTSDIQKEVQSDSSDIKTNDLNISGLKVKHHDIKPLNENNIFKHQETVKHHLETQKIIKKDDVIEEPKKEAKTSVKQKQQENSIRKLKKTDIFHLLSTDESLKTRSIASIKRAREKAKRQQEEGGQSEKIYRSVSIPEKITIADLANRMSEKVSDVIRELMKLGIIASSSQFIDADTAEIVVSSLGHIPKRVQEANITDMSFVDEKEDLEPRAPVVTIMGHVDHGKTSLLDALRSTDVVSSEAGGITQHIGAYRVVLPSGQAITFIDTPGHEAFTAMRSRGAKVTDIVVLVVASDDGIKAQTIEAISHAKAAKVPIIVAINKIDKPSANIEKVKNELLSHNLVPEDLGGDVVVVPVSALKKTNLDKLEEAILLIAELLDIKANKKTSASGVVIEAKVEKGKGIVATILVQRGTLKIGDIIVAGTGFGKVKGMINDKGMDLSLAEPSVPLEIIGLNEVPLAGDRFVVVENEKRAREIAEYSFEKQQLNKLGIVRKSSIEELFSKASGTGMLKELPLIIKADTQGSIEAIVNSLNNLSNEEVQVKILHSAVGGVSDSDIILAKASSAIILGFNVRSSSTAAQIAEKEKIDIRYYSIIYDLIDDIKAAVGGMLSPIIRENYLGSAEIRQVFNITKMGKIAGSYVTKGIIKRGAGIRLLRDNIVIYQGKLKTLKRFKDDVKEVKENFECGIALENYDDIKVKDVIEAFETVEEKRVL